MSFCILFVPYMFNQNFCKLPISLAVGSVGGSMMPTVPRYADASKAAGVFARNKKPAHLAMRGPFLFE